MKRSLRTSFAKSTVVMPAVHLRVLAVALVTILFYLFFFAWPFVSNHHMALCHYMYCFMEGKIDHPRGDKNKNEIFAIS